MAEPAAQISYSWAGIILCGGAGLHSPRNLNRRSWRAGSCTRSTRSWSFLSSESHKTPRTPFGIEVRSPSTISCHQFSAVRGCERVQDGVVQGHANHSAGRILRLRSTPGMYQKTKVCRFLVHPNNQQNRRLLHRWFGNS